MAESIILLVYTVAHTHINYSIRCTCANLQHVLTITSNEMIEFLILILFSVHCPLAVPEEHMNELTQRLLHSNASISARTPELLSVLADVQHKY